MTDLAVIDLGFGWTKGKKGNKIWREPSIVGEVKPLFDENIKAGDIIYKGPEGNFFVGDLAVRQSDVRYTSTKENKAETWITKVLLKTALGSLDHRNSFYLVTGLPIDYYFNQKESFNEMLEEINHSEYYEIDVKKEVKHSVKSIIRKSKIVPQPLGSAMDYLLNNLGQLERKEDARKRLLVIDLGYYTLDLLILEGMEIHKKSCSPPELGVDTAYRLLQHYLKEKIGKTPARYDLDRYVLSGIYEDYDITPLIQKSFQSLALQIQNEVESLNMKFHQIILTGGAAPFIDEFLDVPNKHILHDPQMGNVRGYEKIGRRLWDL